MENCEATNFVTLKGLDFSGSIDDLYEELVAMFTEEWEDYGIPADVVDEFNKTGDGNVLFDWLSENALTLYIKTTNNED